MVRHTCHVWSEDEDRSATEAGIAAIADTLLGSDVSGDTLKFKIYNQIALMYMCQCTAAKGAYHPIRGRLSTPVIAGNPLLLTKGWALAQTGDNPMIPLRDLVYDFRHAPLDMIKKNDTVTAYGYEEDEAGVSHILNIVVVVSDGAIPIGKAPKIDIIHHCTPASATGAASTWKESALTETYSLPAGKYKMWGGRVVSATAIAARFHFTQHGIRPAVIPVFQENQPNHPFSDSWGFGVPFEMPGGLPNLEYCAGANETGDHVELYLTKDTR